MLIYQRVGISFIPLCRARALVANIIAVDVVLPCILNGACKGSGGSGAGDCRANYERPCFGSTNLKIWGCEKLFETKLKPTKIRSKKLKS